MPTVPIISVPLPFPRVGRYEQEDYRQFKFQIKLICLRNSRKMDSLYWEWKHKRKRKKSAKLILFDTDPVLV